MFTNMKAGEGREEGTLLLNLGVACNDQTRPGFLPVLIY